MDLLKRVWRSEYCHLPFKQVFVVDKASGEAFCSLPTQFYKRNGLTLIENGVNFALTLHVKSHSTRHKINH